MTPVRCWVNICWMTPENHFHVYFEMHASEVLLSYWLHVWTLYKNSALHLLRPEKLSLMKQLPGTFKCWWNNRDTTLRALKHQVSKSGDMKDKRRNDGKYVGDTSQFHQLLGMSKAQVAAEVRAPELCKEALTVLKTPHCFFWSLSLSPSSAFWLHLHRKGVTPGSELTHLQHTVASVLTVLCINQLKLWEPPQQKVFCWSLNLIFMQMTSWFCSVESQMKIGGGWGPGSTNSTRTSSNN